jgi:CHAT domain-containing protein
VIEKSISDYREEILQGHQGTQMAHALYSHLLAPISGLNQKQRITIIPDGLLHLLPFEAILMPSGRFLINSYMIDYSSSATAMMLLRKKPGREEIRCRFLGVGDARLSSSDESGNAFFANTLQPTRLPGSRAEVLSIANALKDVSEAVTMLGDEASESAIKALNLSSFDILHFAVHGASDVHFPARSALLFGPRPDEIEDGILQSWEISRLQLKADLVVLSACDTVVGRLLDQEGVSNLVQAFLLAGARSVVASIWPAEDRSAADLMMRFYSYLAQGMDKGSALRQAKLDFIEKYGDKALPIHWAGMLMIGDSSDSIIGGHQGNEMEEEKR